MWTYSSETCAYHLGGETEPALDWGRAGADPGRMLDKARRAVLRGDRSRLVVLGLCSGAMPQALADTPQEIEKIVFCELSPGRVQRAMPELWGRESRIQLIADTSPWAHVYLLIQTGFTPARTAVMRNPELQADQAKALGYASLQRMLTSLQVRRAATTPESPRNGLTVAAILRPDEPKLDEFFKQIPDWVEEAAVVWDGRKPDQPVNSLTGAKLREAVRPLQENFSGQRNAMLELCSGDWVLYLDGDERMEPAVWEALPGLMESGAAGVLFPRLTLFPDAGNAKVGYGLWPDLQLRLFRRTPGLRFLGGVHERLEGLAGPSFLSLDAHIMHYTHLHRQPGAVAAKLQLFDRAGGGAVTHRLSSDYPHLPLSFFQALSEQVELGRLLAPFSSR